MARTAAGACVSDHDSDGPTLVINVDPMAAFRVVVGVGRVLHV